MSSMESGDQAPTHQEGRRDMQRCARNQGAWILRKLNVAHMLDAHNINFS